MKNHKFNKFKELGLYSSEVPHIVSTTKSNEPMVLTAAGHYMYENGLKKLSKYSTSARHPDHISCMAASKYYQFTGCGNVVRVFKNKKTVHTELHCDAEVKFIISMDEDYVIAIDRMNNLKCWLIETGTEKGSFTFGKSNFDITCAIHPLTKKNKILLGSSSGKIKLFNVNKMVECYEYELAEPVTCMQQTPFDPDVVAVGCHDGRIVFLNTKYDSNEFTLRQDQGPVTCLSFTTTNLDLLVVGTFYGHVCVMEYNKSGGCLKSTLENAHKSAVANITCLHNENTFVTNSGDNSIKMYTIDPKSLTCNQLKERCGHHGSLSKITFYDDESVLSTGDDSVVKMYKVMNENGTKSFGTAAFDKSKKNKLPKIVDIKLEKARENDWEGMVAVHNKHPMATTWNVKHQKLGQHKFYYDKGTSLTCAEITSCGNFAIVGSSKGDVKTYNLQSGIARGEFEFKKKPAHDKKVVAVVIDDVNDTVVTVGDDLKVKFWNFKRKKLSCKPLTLKSKPLFAKVHRPTSMLAVALVDFQIRVYDVETRNVARIFDCRGTVTDLAWSGCGGFIVTSSADCYVRTFDMSLGVLIDQFPVDEPVTSLCLSPNGALLATSHSESPAISLWHNSSMFGVNSYTIESHRDSEEEEMEVEEVVLFEERENYSQIAENLLTSSGLPQSRWANLSDLDIIRARNKPKEPVTKITSAPFFLDVQGEEEEKENSVKKNTGGKDSFKLFEMSPFARDLVTLEPEEMMNKMKEMGPSHIDAGIRSLQDPSAGLKFLKMCLHFYRKRINFELADSYLGLFLKVHCGNEEVISLGNEEFRRVLKEVQEEQAKIRKEWGDLYDELMMCCNFMTTSLN